MDMISPGEKPLAWDLNDEATIAAASKKTQQTIPSSN